MSTKLAHNALLIITAIAVVENAHGARLFCNAHPEATDCDSLFPGPQFAGRIPGPTMPVNLIASPAQLNGTVTGPTGTIMR
jgi:hypothetical protein